ncbi:MAG: hypothetical protein JWO79_3571, partial [Actinomycetia bacterium]|nr:hypothetical protein [Actinomycetes bacterium]
VTGEFRLGGPGALVRHRLGSASAVTLAAIDSDTQYLELATGLVPSLRARGGEYDDGPVPRGFLAGLSVGLPAIPLLLGGIAILIVWLVRRHRATRRVALAPAFPAPVWAAPIWQAPPPETAAPVPSSVDGWRSPG